MSKIIDITKSEFKNYQQKNDFGKCIKYDPVITVSSVVVLDTLYSTYMENPNNVTNF